MYCSSLLLFLEFITLSNGYMLWNPNRIEYERFKEAADEAIAQEAKVNFAYIFEFFPNPHYPRYPSRRKG